jgi:hypothetical protein
MQTIKQKAINAINSLPDTATLEDIMYSLYVIDKIKNGLNAIDKGKIVSLDALKKEMQSW